MAKVNELIAKAKSQLGIKENPRGSNKVKYNTAYYGREVSGPDYPWCCAFIWWLFKECNASNLFYGGKKTASCTALMNYYKKQGQFSKTPKVGSLVFFNWGSGTIARHIGIVININGNTITTIEGNTAVGNDSNGGEVMQRTRYSNQVLGYAYPYTEGSSSKVTVTLTTLKNGSKSESVKALQILLNGFGCNCGTVDGEFGAKTEAAVKQFQKKNRLVSDGVVGAKTWNALLT